MGVSSGTIANIATPITSTEVGIDRICGRIFSTNTGTTSNLAIAYASSGSNSICSKYISHTQKLKFMFLTKKKISILLHFSQPVGLFLPPDQMLSKSSLAFK